MSEIRVGDRVRTPRNGDGIVHKHFANNTVQVQLGPDGPFLRYRRDALEVISKVESDTIMKDPSRDPRIARTASQNDPPLPPIEKGIPRERSVFHPNDLRRRALSQFLMKLEIDDSVFFEFPGPKGPIQGRLCDSNEWKAWRVGIYTLMKMTKPFKFSARAWPSENPKGIRIWRIS